ncbi:hypothetical protein N9Y89_00410 [bacterium]|nr:hypothetical protein [bacterium]
MQVLVIIGFQVRPSVKRGVNHRVGWDKDLKYLKMREKVRELSSYYLIFISTTLPNFSNLSFRAYLLPTTTTIWFSSSKYLLAKVFMSIKR